LLLTAFFFVSAHVRVVGVLGHSNPLRRVAAPIVIAPRTLALTLIRLADSSGGCAASSNNSLTALQAIRCINIYFSKIAAVP
jgi:hypothetical protein